MMDLKFTGGNNDEKKKIKMRGKVEEKKESLWSGFIMTDFPTLKEYISKKVVAPMVKKLIAETFHKTINMMFYGNGNVSMKDGKEDFTSYSSGRDFSGERSSPLSDAKKTERRLRDFKFEYEEDAQDLVDSLISRAKNSRKSFASMFDALDILGKTGSGVDQHYGWYDADLLKARVVRNGDGFSIDFPTVRRDS